MFGISGLMKKPITQNLSKPVHEPAKIEQKPDPKPTIDSVVDGMKSIKKARRKADPYSDSLKSLCKLVIDDNVPVDKLRDIFRKMATLDN
jgi:hypothetical protein